MEGNGGRGAISSRFFVDGNRSGPYTAAHPSLNGDVKMPKRTYPNLPMTLTAFNKQVSALNKALRRRYDTSFHHAEYAERASPDQRPNSYNLLPEVLNPEYANQCDLFDKNRLSSLKHEDFHGWVVLDLYVYVRYGLDYELGDNAYAWFKDGEFKALTGYMPSGTEYRRMLEEVQK
jgi:hypothetical protein